MRYMLIVNAPPGPRNELNSRYSLHTQKSSVGQGRGRSSWRAVVGSCLFPSSVCGNWSLLTYSPLEELRLLCSVGQLNTTILFTSPDKGVVFFPTNEKLSLREV